MSAPALWPRTALVWRVPFPLENLIAAFKPRVFMAPVRWGNTAILMPHTWVILLFTRSSPQPLAMAPRAVKYAQSILGPATTTEGVGNGFMSVVRFFCSEICMRSARSNSGAAEPRTTPWACWRFLRAFFQGARRIETWPL